MNSYLYCLCIKLQWLLSQKSDPLDFFISHHFLPAFTNNTAHPKIKFKKVQNEYCHGSMGQRPEDFIDNIVTKQNFIYSEYFNNLRAFVITSNLRDFFFKDNLLSF